MALRIIQSKVQVVWLKRKARVVVRQGPKKGEDVEKERRFRVVLGTCIEFDDGWTIVGPDGRVHKGKGTVVRFNYRHRTWSVQRPQRCETNRVGYVFSPLGEPCWLKPERESGFTSRDFERSFSPSFVQLCRAGHALAQQTARKQRANRMKNEVRRSKGADGSTAHASAANARVNLAS